MVETRYGALRTIAVILRVFAWIVGIGCAIGFVVALIWAAVAGEAGPLGIGVMLLIYAVFGFIYLYAATEAIYVILDIEANTRRSADLLQRQAQPPTPTQPSQP